MYTYNISFECFACIHLRITIFENVTFALSRIHVLWNKNLNKYLVFAQCESKLFVANIVKWLNFANHVNGFHFYTSLIWNFREIYATLLIWQGQLCQYCIRVMQHGHDDATLKWWHTIYLVSVFVFFIFKSGFFSETLSINLIILVYDG